MTCGDCPFHKNDDGKCNKLNGSFYAYYKEKFYTSENFGCNLNVDSGNNCKDCKNWIHIDYDIDTNEEIGTCKKLYDNIKTKVENTLVCGENFGCIHFEQKTNYQINESGFDLKDTFEWESKK